MDRTNLLVVLCVFGALLTGCIESISGKREREFCDLNHDLCVNGHLVAKKTSTAPTIDPGRLSLPDLFVRNVGCDAIAEGPNGGVMMGAHIKNLGAATTGTTFDTSASMDVGGDPTQHPVTASLAALASQAESYYQVASIPGADPAHLPPTKFEVYVNPPRPNFPGGVILESNITNNRNCGVCQCDAQSGCTVVQDPTCTAGP